MVCYLGQLGLKPIVQSATKKTRLIEPQAADLFNIIRIELRDYVGTDITPKSYVLRSVLGTEKHVATIQQLENCDALHTFWRVFI